MSDRRKEIPGTEPADRSRLLILGSLGAAAATGGCFSPSPPREPWMDEMKERDERRRAAGSARQAPRPSAPPQMQTPSGIEGGGGGGGSH